MAHYGWECECFQTSSVLLVMPFTIEHETQVSMLVSSRRCHSRGNAAASRAHDPWTHICISENVVPKPLVRPRPDIQHLLLLRLMLQGRILKLRQKVKAQILHPHRLSHLRRSPPISQPRHLVDLRATLLRQILILVVLPPGAPQSLDAMQRRARPQACDSRPRAALPVLLVP